MFWQVFVICGQISLSKVGWVVTQLSTEKMPEQNMLGRDPAYDWKSRLSNDFRHNSTGDIRQPKVSTRVAVG